MGYSQLKIGGGAGVKGCWTLCEREERGTTCNGKFLSGVHNIYTHTQNLRCLERNYQSWGALQGRTQNTIEQGGGQERQGFFTVQDLAFVLLFFALHLSCVVLSFVSF